MKNWIEQLRSGEYPQINVYSQSFEDGVIQHIFDNIGEGTKRYVDAGAGCYGGMVSNTKYLKVEKGWSGLRFDMDNTDDPDIIKEFITPFNIVDLLKKHDCPKEFDFLSVDLDSFDYDITESILKEFKPRVMCLEYNPALPVYSELKLQYEEGYTWDSTNKYGFSFAAGLKLGYRYGYTVVFNHIGQNLFYVKDELIEGLEFPEIEAVQKIDHPINNNAVWVKA